MDNKELFVRRFKKDSDMSSSIDEDNPLLSDYASLRSLEKIHSFLNRVIEDQHTDIIVSTIRKGSWIIDDYLKLNGLKIEHIYANNSSKIMKEVDAKDKDVLIFDDSVKTGESITFPYNKIINPKSIRMGCIAINTDAHNKIKDEFGINVEYLKIFSEYSNLSEGELQPGCQAYYYAYFIVPYISILSLNYSPDYSNLRIVTNSISLNELNELLDEIIKSIDGAEIGTVYVVDKNNNTLRKSCDLDRKYIDSYLQSKTNNYEVDMSKLRVSASIYYDYCEIVITPMVCPICDSFSDGRSLQSLLYDISEDCLKKNFDSIIKVFNCKNYKIVSKTYMHGVDENHSV